MGIFFVCVCVIVARIGRKYTQTHHLSEPELLWTFIAQHLMQAVWGFEKQYCVLK